MNDTIVIDIAIFWGICSVLAFGNSFAQLQREYSSLAEKQYRIDILLALILAIFGPGALIAGLILGHWKYGLKFK